MGCASPVTTGRAVAGVGALTMAAGLLVAGRCDHPGQRETPGSVCSGNPDADDVAKGVGIVAAGGAVLAAGMAIEQNTHAPRAASLPSQRFPEVRGPRRTSVEE
jgi:hypothetical protein